MRLCVLIEGIVEEEMEDEKSRGWQIKTRQRFVSFLSTLSLRRLSLSPLMPIRLNQLQIPTAATTNNLFVRLAAGNTKPFCDTKNSCSDDVLFNGSHLSQFVRH